MNGEYYLSRWAELRAVFDEDARGWRQVLARRYGETLAAAVARAAAERFEALIPELPYIGGDENPLTGSLLEAAECLALYQALRPHGVTAAGTGKILYDAVALPDGDAAASPANRLAPEELTRRRRERAARSQARRYPGDWVYTYVAGDGEAFDYGYDFTECGAQKFYRAQGAEELLPFYCFLDFPKSRAGALGLVRTMTLAEGHALCNHRFQQGRRSELEWPPPFLTRAPA